LEKQTVKSTKKSKDIERAIDSLGYGGRINEESVKLIAAHTVVDLLSMGLTLEQAEKVLRNAALEASRIASEKQFYPKVPGVEIKRESK
jgi:hypothetical protein